MVTLITFKVNGDFLWCIMGTLRWVFSPVMYKYSAFETQFILYFISLYFTKQIVNKLSPKYSFENEKKEINYFTNLVIQQQIRIPSMHIVLFLYNTYRNTVIFTAMHIE